MDYDGDNFDLDPEPVNASRNKASKITLAAMGALGVVLALIGLDVVLIDGAQANAPASCQAGGQDVWHDGG